MKTILLNSLAICLIVIMASFLNIAQAQVDTSLASKPDTVIQEKGKKESKEDKKRKDEFIVYLGPNINMLGIDGNQYTSSAKVGYHLGGAYKRGKFFYWQVGARFSNSVFGFQTPAMPSDSSVNVAVRGIDVPITGGINFLSMVNRIVALRLFISADPTFAVGVNDNDLNLNKDDINSFILYGQAGIGISVAFFILDVGYNYGFQDQFTDFGSKPGQLFINLGFRF